MHKHFVINIVARVLLIVCYTMLFPLAWAVYDQFYSREVLAFCETIILGLVVSLFLRKIFPVTKEDFKKINAKDGLSIVGLSWLSLSAFGALPLFFSGAVPTYTDAFFEIVSGFTTTGASVIPDVEALPRGILFWRSLTHWLGGMGIIVLYIALLPALGSNAFQLYKAEAPGLTVERIDPRIKETAKKLWTVYFFLTALETVLLMAGGMSFFDSLCHTFGTMATGGFSTKTASIGAYSPYIQWVVITFMFLAGANFILHFYALRGKLRTYWINEEFRCYALLILILIPIFTFGLMVSGASASPLRDGAFQVISIVTTTGYSTTDFNLWPHALRFLLVLLMLIGGCGGSTAGGMKVIRHILAFKITTRSVVQAVYPNAILPVKFNGRPISDQLVLAVLAYIVIYFLLMFLGVIFLTISEGCDLITALTASVSALSNIGPGLGRVGATENFSWISGPGKWVLSVLMLTGRLELYSILILFVPSTWKK